jgi:hypothetical protein
LWASGDRLQSFLRASGLVAERTTARRWDLMATDQPIDSSFRWRAHSNPGSNPTILLNRNQSRHKRRISELPSSADTGRRRRGARTLEGTVVERVIPYAFYLIGDAVRSRPQARHSSRLSSPGVKLVALCGGQFFGAAPIRGAEHPERSTPRTHQNLFHLPSNGFGGI